jgi:hypothetical protein
MRPLPCLFLLLPAACGGVGGALRQATLVGQCAEGDAACSRRHPQAPIAVGTRFYPEVSASIDGSSTPSLALDSAAPDILAVEGGALVARKPGTSAATSAAVVVVGRSPGTTRLHVRSKDGGRDIAVRVIPPPGPISVQAASR